MMWLVDFKLDFLNDIEKNGGKKIFCSQLNHVPEFSQKIYNKNSPIKFAVSFMMM